ncbi:MAG: hypothetical protein AAFX00_01410 [Pseudomonadota bacterium]
MTSIDALGATVAPQRPQAEQAIQSPAEAAKAETPRTEVRVQPVNIGTESPNLANRQTRDQAAEALFTARSAGSDAGPSEAAKATNNVQPEIATERADSQRDASQATSEKADARASDDADRRDADTEAVRDEAEFPSLGNVSDEQREAVDRAESAAGEPLSFIEKVAVAARADDMPEIPIEPLEEPQDDFGSQAEASQAYGALGTPGAQGPISQLDLTA